VGPDVSQPRGPVALYGPPKGTRGGQLMSHLARIWFADATWTELPTDAEIVKAVATDPLALGVAGIGYDQGVRYLGLRMERMGAPAFPSIDEIESERYGLAKVLYLYYIEPPTPQVQAVLDFLASDAGRRAIESTGLWAVSPERGSVPLPQ
jgi:phosphate transport system substrate-binding protein